MSNLAKHIHDDNNGLDYTLHRDYYLPKRQVEESISNEIIYK